MKRENGIETSKLVVKDKIMIWDNTMLQLSNVSSVSAAPMERMAFPKWSVLLMVLGFLFVQYDMLLCLLFIGGGLGWIIAWDQINKAREQKKVLSVVTNSGDKYYFVFKDEKFLRKVLYTFKEIFNDKGTPNPMIVVDMKNSIVKGNLHMMNNSKLG